MFRDASEELKRLEAELLAEEEPEEELPPEEEEEDDYFLFEDTRPEGDPEVYQNYSNDYGKNLRNYASGYRAYNTDKTDDDLEWYSKETYKAKKSRTGCLAVVLCLLAIVLAAGAVIWLAYERGLL